MDTVISADGTVIAYERHGEGSPLILVGGAFNDRQTAAPLAAALAPHLTAVTYDRRGRGDSGDTTPYDVQREVEDIAALVTEVGGRAFLYGLSSGAILALTAVAGGLPVQKVAAFEPPFRVEARDDMPGDYLDRLRELTSTGRLGEAVEYFMTTAVGMPPEAVAGMRQSPMWPALEKMSPTLVYDGVVVGDSSIPHALLAGITTPTLVVGSTGSAPWLHAAVRATADAVPGAELRMLDGSFHDVAPETLAPALISFFTD